MLVGGSFGVTPSAKKTFPAVALPFCYIEAKRVVDLCIAIVKVQRDFGNRADRKVARMKYLIHDWGIERFKHKVEEYFGDSLAPPRPVHVHGFNDGMGWHEQGDGLWFYGLNIENGRIKDTETHAPENGPSRNLHHVPHAAPAHASPKHHLLRHPATRIADRLEEILRRHGVPLTEDYTTVRRWAMACPALPTCGLAVAESERVMPEIIDQLEVELAKARPARRSLHHPHDRLPERLRPPLQFRHRPRRQNERQVHDLPRRPRARRSAQLHLQRSRADRSKSSRRSVPVLRYFKDARQKGESFGDFCHRVGKDDLLAKCNLELLIDFP